jgi:hypothetical protein
MIIEIFIIKIQIINKFQQCYFFYAGYFIDIMQTRTDD